ncbi:MULTISPECIES: enhanced serine sensitivity protein SseB C-terminal domain-containing protein [unclassified Streptomyces]|uniref:enhanced serine sensitivity protein SseB C-terminal domain-containing protein n=1 Tax=Streptomyces TaxID=1883 RepID=UPI0003642571|nr:MULTISPECIES: enhanced serine sensitivity protein SseB C-terminal domain-containing protein [unclassified Streptomyces]MYR69891.1 enhanced serine sensitivity protein SseB [Streptomyces sp. SID4939]MYS01193.1 enhanced serine sensitivity protein SseB [Streptomyces sp. SID4940]MYT62959.1 enhanced serine sensitivity protein SseB [Streptomyces sp. SID8357]MYT88765.1 enhanced serine sensitivity protein SseB [Streptomyces sp. SID8360]MYU33675.1 enhanced serine sensitivity protein SseB [Streptomyce
MSASGTAAAGQVEHMLRQVTPGRLDAYEALLRALADGRVWMLLWHGTAGSPDAQYGNMEVDGLGYAPCVTSAQELSASGWNRAHELITGRDIARALFPDRWGIWLNPHAPGGGVGIPWLDLRRIATGLDRMPAGPLRLTEPAIQLPQFYALLSQNAHRTPAVRSLRRAWVQPAVGVPYLAIGLDLYDTGRPSVDAARAMMQQSVGVVPDGLPVSTVSMSDEYDPVAMWLRANARPFYDREAHAAPAVPPPAPTPGYGYPPPAGPAPRAY